LWVLDEKLCMQLTVSMETFGLAIIQTLLTDIEPAAKVKAAMNEINAATRLRAAAAQKAEADKIQVVKAAEADAEAKFLAGQGIARQRQVCSDLAPVACSRQYSARLVDHISERLWLYA
jgi:regulator of protease activity HflC (stomatin/prohibitin superfamily)